MPRSRRRPITTYQYDANGNLTQITDPLGRIRQVQYDALNQPMRQLEPHPRLIGSTLGQIDTTYDSLGQVKSITDPRNLTTSLQYRQPRQLEPTNQPRHRHHPGRPRCGRQPDHPHRRPRQNGQYRYDSLNRISQIAYDDETVRYTWDSCTNGIGRLCSVSNNASSLSYRYDSHGRITGKTQTAGAAPLAVSHSYNAAGQRIQTSRPGGQTLDYQWSGGRLTAHPGQRPAGAQPDRLRARRPSQRLGLGQ